MAAVFPYPGFDNVLEIAGSVELIWVYENLLVQKSTQQKQTSDMGLFGSSKGGRNCLLSPWQPTCSLPNLSTGLMSKPQVLEKNVLQTHIPTSPSYSTGEGKHLQENLCAQLRSIN